MNLDAYLVPQLERLRAEGLLRDPADAAARASTLGRQRPNGAAPGSARGVDATSNDYLGLAAELITVSRETMWVDRYETQGSDYRPKANPTGSEPTTAATRTAPELPSSPLQARAGAGASRLVQGTWPEHEELEAELAEWVGAEAALLFSSGFAANSGAVAALAGPDAVVVSDELNHASLVDGCRLARARTIVVPHLSLEAVEEALDGASTLPARWVVTESYFSMDGDGADLLALRQLCDRYSAFLVVDEAHGLGVFGPGGAGRCAEAGVRPDVLIGTLGKAVGTEGAFVAGSSALRTWLWNRARTFVFSTAPSPAGCALTRRHVKQAIAAEREREALHEHGRTLRRRLAEAAVPCVPGSFGPIVSVVAGSNQAALELAERVREAGILVQAIRPPTVPPGSARVRVTLTAALSRNQVERIADALTEAWAAMRAP